MAEMNTTLDAIIYALDLAIPRYGPEESVMGAALTIQGKAESVEALSQYLAVAVYRIWSLQNAVMEIATTYKDLTGDDIPGVTVMITKDNDWPPAN